MPQCINCGLQHGEMPALGMVHGQPLAINANCVLRTLYTMISSTKVGGLEGRLVVPKRCQGLIPGVLGPVPAWTTWA